MSTKKAIEEVVERFVEDIRSIIRRVQAESRASALGVVMSQLHEGTQPARRRAAAVVTIAGEARPSQGSGR